ncbi:MAG: radical SAM protein [Clostridia bacterium]|nr:radical SAM protein [Clostridia bacterium]
MLPNLTSFNLETVVLQLTTRCPYNCPQCYMQRGDMDMSVDVAKKAIDEAAGLGAVAIQITGGEPLVCPHVFEVIEYASSSGLKSFLATSGYNCSDGTYSRLKSAGLTALCVSVNGITEESNSRSRASFGESLYAMKLAKVYNILCFLNVVVTDSNIDELALLGKYAEGCGACGVNILHPVTSYNGDYLPRCSEETVKKLAGIVCRSPNFFHVENCHREYWQYFTKNEFSCGDIGKTTYFVNVDGTVSPCSKMMRCKYSSISEMLAERSDWECGCL